MSEGMYAVALKKALTEIKNLSPDINYSFLLSQDGTIVAEDEEADPATVKKVVHSFQGVLEKATTIDGLESYLVTGEKGKVNFSRTGDMYLTMMTSKNADIANLQSTPRLVIPTILKLFEEVIPTPTKTPEAGKLIIESFNSNEFMTRFAGETVQVGRELLIEWAKFFDGKVVGQIQIETPTGKTAVYKVKAINDRRKGIIRVSEKTCRSLGLRDGQSINVKPLKSSTPTQNLTFALKTS